MKLKTKAGQVTFTLTLTADEASAVYLAMTPANVENYDADTKLYGHAVKIEAALADALDDFGIHW